MTDTDDAGPTRRQLLTALGVTGLGAAGYGYGSTALGAGGSDTGDGPATQFHVETTTALATAVYPTSVDVDEAFVERRVFGRTEPTPGHFEEVVAAVEAVDSHARARFGGRVTDLSPGRRRAVLESMGVTEVHPTPDGTTAERVRFYLLNDLLYALFTAPESSELTGIDNPPGHPGGRKAYRRGPGEVDR